MEPSGTKSGSKPFVWNSGTPCFYNHVDPSGSEWIRIRIQALLLGILARHVFTTKWNQVDPSQDPSLSLGILAKGISTRTLIIILIKSPGSRNQGPQNGNCRILQKGAGGSPLIHSRAALHSLITGKQHPGIYLRRALEQCSS